MFSHSLAQILASFVLEEAEVNEYAYGFFGFASETLPHEVAAVVPSFVDSLIESLQAVESCTFSFTLSADDP